MQLLRDWTLSVILQKVAWNFINDWLYRALCLR
ncbi:hypothetical protein AB3S75_013785 [Citrus x aurantiifolia]